MALVNIPMFQCHIIFMTLNLSFLKARMNRRYYLKLPFKFVTIRIVPLIMHPETRPFSTVL
jgi:hypothetical protein